MASSGPFSLPALTTAQSFVSKTKPKESDESIAINSLCKTLNATVTKLLHSFSALNSDSLAGKDTASSSIALALAASKRDELSTKIADSLAASVEKVIRCKDASLRSMALREVRARFAVAEKPKPEMCDQGVQAAPRKPKVSLLAAAAASMSHNESPSVVAFNSSFRKSPKDGKQGAATPPPAPALSDEEILKQLADSQAAAAPAAAPDAQRPGGTDSAKPEEPRAGAEEAAAASGKKSLLPGIYERQMQWAAKAAEKREQAKLDKENREREAEKPPEGSKKAAGRWAHVESVMKRERIKNEEGWKADMQAEMDEERELRREAERKARAEAAERQRLEAEKAKAEQAQAEAVKKMDAAHARAVVAEGKYEKAKKAQDELASRHAEELEIRDAFGETGLEVWPMFPGRKVFRTLDTDEFDGRVSQEFRVKDSESGERGVTLLMGRLAGGKASEAQAVLFEERHLTDLQAARWWQNNGYRFQQVRERIDREKQRAQSAQPGARSERSGGGSGGGSSSTRTEEFLQKFPGLR